MIVRGGRWFERQERPRPSSDMNSLRVMAMPEQNCNEHTEKVVVTIDTEDLKKKQHTNLIAALLRQIADYTDGWCATEYAKDENLESRFGMIFYFTSDEKRTRFIGRIGFYLRKDIATALSARKA
jgi:hypothetical protein